MKRQKFTENDTIAEIAEKTNNNFYGPHDFVQTSPCGIGEHHPHGMVGNLWRINNPYSVRVGDCFLKGRLKNGDLFLCTEHSGDCFQTYIYVKEYENCLVAEPKWNFGSYGIGDSEKVELTDREFEMLKAGEIVKRE